MLLLLGWSKEERPMRVSPWNQYKLVEQEGDCDHQLASRKSSASRGCASFVCFGRAFAGVDGPSPPNVGPINHSETFPDTSSSASDRTVNKHGSTVSLKSSLKKPSVVCSTTAGEGDHLCDSIEVVQNSVLNCTERRKIQWTDSCGRELVQMREFEPSDDGTSDDEFEHDGDRRCRCVIQ